MEEGIVYQIIAFMEKKIGISPASMSREQWIKLIQARMADAKISNLEEYYQKLAASPLELQEFTELIVVPETWFFRDRELLIFSKALLSILGYMRKKEPPN